MFDPVYIIGIDLGTTNTVVAFTPATPVQHGQNQINIFKIPQFISSGVIESREITPSFIYIPTEIELSEDYKTLHWMLNDGVMVGEYARERGAEVPQRMIASAKSWLCNTLIDRNKPLLPWGSLDSLSKISPVEASARILAHIKNAWNHEMAGSDKKLRMENQEIFLTVPASFDAIARELTVKAAEKAGLSHITLLEEPQSAFYAWIASSNEQWRKYIQKGDLILVCDIGGGTSDFSLIEVSENNGELVLERVAVGEHLLVGGDNMDLAMAYSVASELNASGTRLDQWQMRMLIQSCRNAKERLLSEINSVAEYPVTVLGRGSSLIGGTIKTSLTRNEISRFIVDGFFPICDFTSMPQQALKVGLKETGLSYEADPSITRHLAKFLNRQIKMADKLIKLPTAVLFNGGVIKSPYIRQRIMDVMNQWKSTDTKTTIREIVSNEFDLAVARGAAYYGLATHGHGIRIRGGLGKSYYIGIAASMPAVPGIPSPVKALCVAPFGMEEGTGINLQSQEFVLVVGEPVRFDFLCSPLRNEDSIGTIVEDWQNQLKEITTLETTLDGEAGDSIRVTIEIKVTEIGTLELWCASTEDDRKWKLEFNVREQNEL